MPRNLYLDNSQTTAPSKTALSKMMPFYSEKWGVFSQPHQKGQELAADIAEAYKNLYALFRAKEEDEVIFTSSGAEAVNQVIQGLYFEVTIPTGKNHYIVGKVDEAPALMATHRLEQSGCVATMILPDPKQVVEALSARSALVSLSWGNGLTGELAPVREIGKILRDRGVKFHLEASHVVGKLWFDPYDIGADYISFGGDLIHAPKSTGALWVRAKEKIPKLLLGGLEQDGYRAGPLDTASLAALSEAAKEAIDGLDYLSTEVARLRGKFERELQKLIPEVLFPFQNKERLPHISTAIFPGCPSETFLFLLQREGCFATMGGGSLQQIGHVLTSLGFDEAHALSALSFSLSRETSDEDIERACRLIQEVYLKLKRAWEPLS